MTGDIGSPNPPFEPTDNSADSSADKRFDQWAIVELMGHQRMAGRVTECTIAGGAFLRIDVPEVTVPGRSPDSWGAGWPSRTIPAFTRLVSPSAIYAINPTTEEIARRAAQHAHAEPLQAYAPPAHTPAPQLPGADGGPVEQAAAAISAGSHATDFADEEDDRPY